MKQKSISKLLILSLAIVFTAQSCNRQQPRPEEIELTWWKPFDDARIVEPLISEFQKVYPNVRVNYTQKNIENYEDELRDALAAGEGPDIFSIHNDWLPKHKAKMTPAPEKIFGLKDLRQNFVEVLETDLVSDSQVYALPLAVDVLALFYNKDLFASAGLALPPETW